MSGLVFVLPAAHRDTVRAALVLVIWYGLRGIVAELLSRGRRRSLLLEYGSFVVGAAAVIAVRVLRS
jgi:hypothetical protein